MGCQSSVPVTKAKTPAAAAAAGTPAETKPAEQAAKAPSEAATTKPAAAAEKKPEAASSTQKVSELTSNTSSAAQKPAEVKSETKPEAVPAAAQTAAAEAVTSAAPVATEQKAPAEAAKEPTAATESAPAATTEAAAPAETKPAAEAATAKETQEESKEDTPAEKPVETAAPAVEEKPAETAKPEEKKPEEASAQAPAQTGPKAVVAIVYYSMYGHVAGLAKNFAKGVEAAGAEARLYQVPETLPEEVLKKMQAPPKDSSVPVITDPSVLLEADAIVFGISTRYGTLSAQLKAFLDSTGKLWQSGGFVGKIGSTFFSTSTVGGGQESAAFTLVPFFVHHGMIFAPPGYTNPALFSLELHGGSPWGAGTITGGDGMRMSSEDEQGVATSQGSLIAGYASRLKRGRSSA